MNVVFRSRFAICTLGAMMLGLAACSTAPIVPRPASGSPSSAPAALDAAMDLLNRGNEAGALKQIKAQLKRNPQDPSAHVLLESIQRDPVELLGQRSFAYTVQPGETMIALSERFLGNRLKFYQLARYNDVKTPMGLAAGSVLRIPGEPPRPVVPSRQTSPGTASEMTEPSRPVRPRPAPAEAAKTPANPGAALKLRSLGLTALNQGRVDQAVALLGKAAQLDPANALIAHDLARAERIAQTVKSRR